MPVLRDPIAYFEASYIPEPNSGCWLWMNGLMDGYGAISVSQKNLRARPGYRMQRAHCMAWLLYKGAIPVDLHVLHRCDVRSCVNPDHLFLGTEVDNAADRVAKGRDYHPGQPGELNGAALLTKADVIEIRRRKALGENWKVLGKEFGVSHKTVWKITTGRSWRHV